MPLQIFGDLDFEPVVMRGQPARRTADLAPGEGGIVSSNGQKVARYRDDTGALHAASTRCTHLRCQVAWNAAGPAGTAPATGLGSAPTARYSTDPATKPLRKRPTSSDRRRLPAGRTGGHSQRREAVSGWSRHDATAAVV